MKSKYIFVGMVIRNGIYTYSWNMVYEIPIEKSTQEFAEQTIKNYHANKTINYSAKDGWWYFLDGEESILLETVEEITKAEYDVLNKFQYK